MTPDSVALVTGAASGIGRAIALRYAREGFRVVVSDVDEAGGQETAQQIEEGGGGALFVSADVSDPAAVDATFGATIGEFGGLDVLVCAAGILGPNWDARKVERKKVGLHKARKAPQYSKR